MWYWKCNTYGIYFLLTSLNNRFHLCLIDNWLTNLHVVSYLNRFCPVFFGKLFSNETVGQHRYLEDLWWRIIWGGLVKLYFEETYMHLRSLMSFNFSVKLYLESNSKYVMSFNFCIRKYTSDLENWEHIKK